MRTAWGIGAIALAFSCYRDSTPPPAAATTTRAPRTQARTLTCGHDDLQAPPLDLTDGRLRTHTDGPLSGAGARRWAGPVLPLDVERTSGTLELFIADEVDGGTLAFYREPYGLQSCQLAGAANCAYEVRFYDARGAIAWSLRLNDLFSRPDHLEVQDLRLAGGILYFNEACQSYAAEAGGRCSSLVAVDPVARRVLWRSESLVSNGRFRVRGCYIVAGYGFTSEADAVFLVDRATGKVLDARDVSSAPEALRLLGPDRLDVQLYSGTVRQFRLDGFDGPRARLVPLDPDEALDGGAYGGAAYGGRPARDPRLP